MAITTTQQRVVLAVCLLATVWSSPGQTYLISAFYESLTKGLAISKTELSATYMGGTLLAALPMAYVGRVSDRFGPRRTLIGVALGLGMACVAMANVAGVLSLLVTFLFLRLLGQGSINLVSSHALALSYDRKLGAVEGIRMAAIAVAVATFPILAVWMSDGLGWREAWYVLGVGTILMVVPAAYFGLAAIEGRSRLGGATSTLDGDDLKAAMRTPAYWILAGILVMNAGVITAVHFHSQGLMEVVGLNKAGAAATMATYATASLFATLGGGWLADRMRPRFLFAGSVFCLGASSALLGFAKTPAWAHLGMAILGVAHGIAAASIGPVVARNFGRKHFGAIRGSFATVTVAGTSFGPLLLGWWDDTYGRFDGAMYLLAAATVPLVFASLTLRARHR